MRKKVVFLNCLLGCLILVIKPEIVFAQLVGSDAYMKGNYLEIGINGTGGFEGVDVNQSPIIPGMHPRTTTTNYFGFVANPQMDGWVNFDGDFFTPGTPENGWGITIGNSSTSAGAGVSNNCFDDVHFSSNTPRVDISGSITSWSHTGSFITTVWDGTDTISGLHFNITNTLGDNDLFYITTVLVNNPSSSSINDIYYYRNLDPDNNVSINSIYTTVNTIISQYGNCSGCMARVSATQPPGSSYFELLAIDTGYVAGYGGFSNRNGYNMYTGLGFTQAVASVDTLDEAIYLAYKIDSLPASGSMSFRYASIFAPSSVPSAVTSLQHSVVTGIKEIDKQNPTVSVYPNPAADNVIISIEKRVTLSNAAIYFYNVVGNEVKSIPVESLKTTLNITGLSKGIYYYKLVNGGESISNGKLIIQ